MVYCICLASPQGAEGWRIHASCEILAFHQYNGAPQILAFIVVERLKGNAFLQLLHPGNSTCKNLKPIPLPNHSDELNVKSGNALTGIYPEIERWESVDGMKNLCRRFGIDYYDYAHVALTQWKGKTGFGKTMRPMYEMPAEKYVPFTNWDLGEFPGPGIFVMAFHLTVSRSTFSRYSRTDGFTVDGPERLLHRIASSIETEFPLIKKNEWFERLGIFKNTDCLLLPESYDIGILEQPYAENVRVINQFGQNGIYTAPEQTLQYGKRYIATKHSFSLPLQFSEKTISESVEFRRHVECPR